MSRISQTRLIQGHQPVGPISATEPQTTDASPSKANQSATTNPPATTATNNPSNQSDVSHPTSATTTENDGKDIEESGWYTHHHIL